jgi:predicted nucleotidyltransferase
LPVGRGKKDSDVDILVEHEREDILEALSYAAWRAEEIEVSLAS